MSIKTISPVSHLMRRSERCSTDFPDYRTDSREGRFDACNNPGMPAGSTPPRSRAFAVLLVVLGLIGLAASFALTVDKFRILEDPGAVLGCNVSVLVQCGANLNSPQGAVFGFPNPLIGLVGFTAPIVVGAAILAGARFRRWFWITFDLGLLGALAFVVWLIGQSVFTLFTLCPWCMVVWSVTIPLFLLVTLANLRDGVLPTSARGRRMARSAYAWIPLITVGCYLAVAILAQVRLDVIGSLT